MLLTDLLCVTERKTLMANKHKKFIALLLAAALFGTLAACGSDNYGEEQLPDIPESSASQTESYAADNVFTLNCDKEFSFNPFSTTSVTNILCTQVMYDTVVAVDQNFNGQPGVALSWSSEDGVHWSFKVDTAVKFWDGTALTATDVSYSLQRAKQSPQFKTRLKSIMGVSAISEGEFIVTLNAPNMGFPCLLDIPVIKEGTVGDNAPMGTGPYMPDEGLTKLTAFADHKNAASMPFDAIYLKEYKEIDQTITAFENSEIDLVTNDPTGFRNLGYGTANDIRTYPTTNMHYLGFNAKSEFFSNPLCRKAMTYVVDREKIVSDCLKGFGSVATLPMHPACDLYNGAYSEMISYSVKKSEQAFDEAQVQDYDDDQLREIMVTGIPMEIYISFIVCNDSAAKVAAARSIKANMEALGINVTLHELSWEDYLAALTNGSYDMYYAEAKLTADFSMRELVGKGGSLNYGKISDSAMDTYINDFMSSGQDGRKKTADLMFKYITDTAPIVTICFEKQQVITHRGVISGMKPTQFNIFYGIEDWETDTN